MKALNYNIHLAINYKSIKKGLYNDNSLTYYMKKAAFKLSPDTSFQKYGSRPANTYGVYYPNVYGKRHSQYPR